LHRVKNFRYSPIAISDEVATALGEGRGIVALETTIVVQGLPAPINLEVASDCEAAVRASGAVPATIGILDGEIVVGLSAEQLARLAEPSRGAAKLSSRDIGVALALGIDGATTVAGTITIASGAGIDVMATGGLGGVHRHATESFDESADLVSLAQTQTLVVASGVKSILDIGATLERLDTLGIPVFGYRTTKFPGFYLRDSGFDLDWSIETPEQAAAAFLVHREFRFSGVVVANPIDADKELDRHLHDEALEAALTKAHSEEVTGKAVTPSLLAEFARHTAGVSVQVNRDLVVANAALAGDIAVAVAQQKA
jgi:pseudouridine-5'-phosphate glycosidase